MAFVKDLKLLGWFMSEKWESLAAPLLLGCLPSSETGAQTLLVRDATSAHSSKPVIYKPMVLNGLENSVYPFFCLSRI